MTSMRATLLACGLLCGVMGFSTDALSEPHFVPNSQAFWDFSKNWTTGFGPAYRDTVEKLENLVPCTGQYALCFTSGPEPLPCELTKDGRFANCTCTIETGLNYVLISAILNYQVYLDTVAVCGTDGSSCAGVENVDKAPVCRAIREKKLIPGAKLISTFGATAQSQIGSALDQGPSDPSLTICPKGPYAGCMTAPCKTTKAGDAECSCPVFWGGFQLTQAGAECNLGDDLVWSASFSPLLIGP
jgi:hypothetical protein